MNDHEDGRPFERVDQADVDTERPTGPGSTPVVPSDEFGFPRPARTGDPVLDTLLALVTELRDGVRALTEGVSRLGTNHDLVSKSIQNFGTTIEGLRTEVAGRFAAVESRLASIEQWRASQSKAAE